LNYIPFKIPIINTFYFIPFEINYPQAGDIEYSAQPSELVIGKLQLLEICKLFEGLGDLFDQA
jgi:hypothetical protein